MKKVLNWLAKNKLIAIFLAFATYLSIVTFHDEITTLAIKMRNSIGRDNYNIYLGYFFLALLLFVVFLFARIIMKSERKWLKLGLAAGITGLMVLSFRFLMTYNIEAIHFVEYFLVAILLVIVQTFLFEFAIYRAWSVGVRNGFVISGLVFDIIFSVEFMARSMGAAGGRGVSAAAAGRAAKRLDPGWR